MKKRTNCNTPRVTINQRSTSQRIKAYKRKRWYRSVYTQGTHLCIRGINYHLQIASKFASRLSLHTLASRSSGTSDESFAIAPWYLLRVSMIAKQLETRAFNDRKISLISRILRGYYAWVLLAVGRMGQLTFPCRDTRTTGKMWTYGHPMYIRCLSESPVGSVSSVRSGQWAIQHEQRAQWVIFLR